MRPITTVAAVTCTGGCGRELASTNQPSLDDILSGNDTTAPAPHHKHTTVCVDCIRDGYVPPAIDNPAESTGTDSTGTDTADEPPQPVYCLGCDRNLNPNPTPTLVEALTTATDTAVPHRKHPNVCVTCIKRGYVPPKPAKRRDIVIENCEFYLAHGIGLTEAAGKEGYADRSHLDSVLRRWGRLDLTHALGALDPIQMRERA